MRLKVLLNAAAWASIVNIFVCLPISALEERRESAAGTYEKIQRQVRLSAGQPVFAYCDAGDVAVEAFCDGAEQTWFPVRPRTVDMVGVPEPVRREIRLKSSLLKATDRSGASCMVEIVHPEQILRVNAHVICRSRL